MAQSKDELTTRLAAAIEDLPPDKIAEVLDFVDYLHRKYGQHHPRRGSAEAIIQALDQVGPLVFEPGELDRLLADIEHMRDLDVERDG